MTKPGSTASFRIALFFIKATLYANFNVETVSSTLLFSTLIVAIIRVMQLPPKESLKTKVIKLSLYGI